MLTSVNIRKVFPSLILTSIVIFHLINTFIWLKIDKSFLKLDAWDHYRYSLEVYDFLKAISRSDILLGAVEPMRWHGLLVGFIVAPFYFIFGNAQDTAIMINSSIFLVILTLSTYGIGKKLFDKKTGILAAFIVTSYPIIFNNLRFYMLDLPLTGMVALSLYLLIASGNFTDRKNSLLFGLSLGLGFLIKFNYGAFIIGPLIITCYNALIKKGGVAKNTLKNIVYLMLTAIFLCTAFYMARHTDMLNRISQVSYSQVAKNHDFYLPDFLTSKFKGFLQFVEIFVGQGMSFLLFTAFVLGLWLFIKLRLKDRWLMYLGILIPILIQLLYFIIPADCMFRYSMPVLPMAAIISAAGLMGLKNIKIKKVFLTLLISLGIMQFFAVSYGVPVLSNRINLSIPNKLYNVNMALFEQNTCVPPFLRDKTSHPSIANWKSSEVLGIIRSTNTEKTRVKVISLSNIPELFEAMAYQIFIKRELIDLIPAISITTEKFYDERSISLDKMCLTADYVILSEKTDSVWERVFDSDPSWREKIGKARKVFRDNIAKFKLVGTELLPDNSPLLIYKNISKLSDLESSEIQQKDIKLVFDSGRGRIFYKNVEITKGLGLYTSLFSLQHWRDSMEAGWQVKKLSATKLIAQGRWMFIPVSQTWELELKGGNTVSWNVTMEIHDTLKIEIEDFKLMLSDEYEGWFISNDEQGAFPGSFEKDLWKKLWVGNIGSEPGLKPVDFKNMFLPGVRFHVSGYPPHALASVENSDQLFNGRVIGCFKTNTPKNNIFYPGQYKYFSAEIRID